MPNVELDNGLYVGDAARDASAGLELDSTTSGFLPPRMTTTQRDAITLPATGLMVFNTTTNRLETNTGTPASPVWTSTPLASANKVHHFGSNQTTVSNTMVDVDATNAAITITAKGDGLALVIFSYTGFKATAGSAFFQQTDGTIDSDEVEIVNAAGVLDFTLAWLFATTAGATTYKLQFRSDDANAATISGGVTVRMSAVEIA